MKVKELIEKLSKLNQDLPVYVPKNDFDFGEYKLADDADIVELASVDDDLEDLPCVRIE
jgi:hypothetical protein